MLEGFAAVHWYNYVALPQLFFFFFKSSHNYFSFRGHWQLMYQRQIQTDTHTFVRHTVSVHTRRICSRYFASNICQLYPSQRPQIIIMPLERKISENLDLASRFFHCFTTMKFIMLNFDPNKLHIRTVILAVLLHNESNFGTLRHTRARLIRSTTLMAVLISYETVFLGYTQWPMKQLSR